MVTREMLNRVDSAVPQDNWCVPPSDLRLAGRASGMGRAAESHPHQAGGSGRTETSTEAHSGKLPSIV